LGELLMRSSGLRAGGLIHDEILHKITYAEFAAKTKPRQCQGSLFVYLRSSAQSAAKFA
jgi:hypothetical protein